MPRCYPDGSTRTPDLSGAPAPAYSGRAILFSRLLNIFIFDGKVATVIRTTDISQGIGDHIESFLTIGSPCANGTDLSLRHFRTLSLRPETLALSLY